MGREASLAHKAPPAARREGEAQGCSLTIRGKEGPGGRIESGEGWNCMVKDISVGRSSNRSEESISWIHDGPETGVDRPREGLCGRGAEEG